MTKMGGIMTYHDRGDPASVDFSAGDVTTDATWRDLDLSSIIGKGSKAVALLVELKDNAMGSYMWFRKKGNSNSVNKLYFRLTATNWDVGFNGIVGCDNEGVIQYKGANVAFTSIGITVTGWFA